MQREVAADWGLLVAPSKAGESPLPSLSIRGLMEIYDPT